MKERTLYKEQFRNLGKKIDVGSVIPSPQMLNPYVILGFEEDEKCNLFAVVVFKKDFETGNYSEEDVIKKSVSGVLMKKLGRDLKREIDHISTDEIYLFTQGKRYKTRKEFEEENSKYILKPHRQIQEPFFRCFILGLYVIVDISMIFMGRHKHYDNFVIIGGIVLNTLFFLYLLLMPIYYLSDVKK